MNRMELAFNKPNLLGRVRAHQVIVHSSGDYHDKVTLRSGGGKNETIKLDRSVTKKEKGLITTHNNAKGKGRQERTNKQLPEGIESSHS